MVKIKNIGTESMDITVIRETLTTLAAGEEKDIALNPATERMEIKPTPTP